MKPTSDRLHEAASRARLATGFLSTLVLCGLLLPGCDRDEGSMYHFTFLIAPPDGCVDEYYHYDVAGAFNLASFSLPREYTLVEGEDYADLGDYGLSLDGARGFLYGVPTQVTPPEGITIGVAVTEVGPATPRVAQEELTLHFREFAIVSHGPGLECSEGAPHLTVRVCGGSPNFTWTSHPMSVSDVGWHPFYGDEAETSQRENILRVDLPHVRGEATYLEFEVEVAESGGETDSKVYEILVTDRGGADDAKPAPLPPFSLPNAHLHSPYPAGVCLQYCPATLSMTWWTLSSLPSGMTFEGGCLGGTPDSSLSIGSHRLEARLGWRDEDDPEDDDVATKGLYLYRVLAPFERMVYSGGPVVLTECLPCDVDLNPDLADGLGERYWYDRDEGDLVPGVQLTREGRLQGQPTRESPLARFPVRVVDAVNGFASPYDFVLEVEVRVPSTDPPGDWSDDPDLHLLHVRQWPADDPEHEPNVVVLNLPFDGQLMVDFEILEPSLDGDWSGFIGNRQVVLQRLGACEEITSVNVVERDVDGDGDDEWVASFDQEEFVSLVDAEPATYGFRVRLQENASQPEYADFLVNRIERISVQLGPE